MKPGDICLIVGGHILRYQGPYARAEGPRPIYSFYGPRCLAFRSPEDGLSEPAVGASIGAEDVIRVLTKTDLPWLRARHEQLVARKLPGIQHVIDEVSQ